MTPAAASLPRAAAETGGDLARHLRQAVLDDVFERLAAGFVDGRRRRGLPPETEDSLREVFDGTFRLLLRLLRALHAEAHGRVPVGGAPAYERYGLMRLRRTVAEKLDAGERIAPDATEAWSHLSNLFHLLDHGDPALGVAGPGGGLLPHEDERGGFLRDNPVADAFLARALDALSRIEGTFVDYAAWSVEDVAGILEGVPELRLVPDERGRPRLVDARGERAAPGSHALPRWLTDYVFAETIGPALSAREAAYRDAAREVAVRRERLAAGAESPARLEREIDAMRARAVDHLLDLRVCDPAMGSGRFLLRAAGWIAARVEALLDETPGDPLREHLSELRAEIAAGLRAQGIAADPTEIADADLLRRLVVRRCLFGVDAHPLHVELAEAALSLAAFVPGAPPVFLEHRLRAGNALVGTRVAEVQRAIEENPHGQFEAFGGPFDDLLGAARPLRDVARGTDATYTEAAESQVRADEAERALAPFRRLLDLWVSRAFGNRRAEEVATLHPREALAAARGAESRLGPPQRETLAEAAERAKAHGFFHWDLELPEAFAELERGMWSADAGFDAVVGRPPQARDERFAALRPYLAHAYADVHDSSADPSVYFHRLGLDLLRRGGRMALVAGNRWLRAGAGEGLRRVLAAHADTVVDLGPAGTLPDADLTPAIVIARRADDGRAPAEARVAAVPREALGGGLAEWVAAHAHAVPRARFGAAPWSLEPQAVEALVRKIREGGVPLRALAGSAPLFGAKTGLNDAFVIDGETRERLVREHPGAEALIRPYLRGHDAGRWAPSWAGLWIVLLSAGEGRRWPWSGLDDLAAEQAFRAAYPSVYAHLKPFEDRLRLRGDRGPHWWELRALPDEAFARPKVVYPDVAWTASFAYDPDGHVPGSTACFIPTDSLWLVAVLNSPVMWTYLWRSAGHGRDDEAFRFFGQVMEALPVAEPEGAVEAEAANAVQRLAELTYERRALTGELLSWVRADYGVAQPGPRLEGFAELNAGEFVEEVKGRRPKKADPLTPREVGMLRNAHAEYTPRLTAVHARIAGLERRLAQLVHRAYRLSADEVELMWATAPPRMPVGR